LENLSWLINVAKVALGLGLVIFLHELGHFLLAKWNGVKVEKFSIGFGPTLLGFTRGETEYVLAAVPLGGFVKMLGEGTEEGEDKTADPRAYPNKSVGARMAIISAGVIMNLILGLGCFVYAYKMGVEEMSTVVGLVVPGSPAYVAGIRPGDEIAAVDGRRDLSFNTVTLKIRLSGRDQALHFEMKRPGRSAPVLLDLRPVRDSSSDHPSIGILPAPSLNLADPPFEPPAGLGGTVRKLAGLEPHDRITAAGVAGAAPTPLTDAFELYRLFDRERDKPVDVRVERRAAVTEGNGVRAEVFTVNTTLPPVRFVDFGFRLKPGPIAAVRDGSIAEKAGFRKGDVVTKVDGRDDFDPMRLPTLCHDHAGVPMSFEVERPERGSEPKGLTLTATPDDSLPWTELPILADQPLDVPGLGLATDLSLTVAAVTPDSPADKAGLKAGDVINALTMPGAPVDGKPGKPAEFKFDDRAHSWPRAWMTVQLRPVVPVELRVNNKAPLLTMTARPDPTWFNPMRGLQLEFLTRRTPALSVVGAIRRGFDDTVDNILSIYSMFRSLAQSRLSPKNLGGPIFIGQIAFQAAKLGLTDLVRFLGVLSINLAVLNFLPIPPLDGGQMVFLAAEKVRGRPLPDSAVNAGTLVGLTLVLCLMVFVLYQDVWRIVQGYL